MHRDHIRHLVCPSCVTELRIHEIKKESKGRIERGTLKCNNCHQSFDITQFIPRFVSQSNYADGFGIEWMKHARTQYDSYSKINASEERFFNESKWPRSLRNEIILEVGCGSGRFTEQALKTGAMIVSIDYSKAVEATYASNGDKPNVLIVQADLYRLPFRKNYFDRLFCFGVLQHTPRVKEAFFTLPAYLKPGGSLAIDVYRKRSGLSKILATRYWVRPFTKRINPELLYQLCRVYVNCMWPISRITDKVPVLRNRLMYLLLVADYRGKLNLPDEQLKEWAILDTFDMLSPMYDQPQTLETVKRWFAACGMINIEVHKGYNGIEGRAIKG